MNEDDCSEKYVVAEAVNEMIEKMARANIDPDYLSYIMIAAAYSMLIRNNLHNPLIVGNVLASAIKAALSSVCDDDVDEVRH